MKMKKINPVVLAAIILVGAFFLYKFLAFLGCYISYGEADTCWHLTFLKVAGN